MSTTAVHRSLIAAFLALLAVVPLVQTVAELRRDDSPVVAQVFRERPTKESLAAFERRVEDASVAANALRPWMQAARFFGLHESGAKVLVGRGGQLFYAPGVDGITQRGRSLVPDALAATVAFRDALGERGIRLIVVPVPNKESVYPQWLSRASSPPEGIINPDARAFLEGCASAGVEAVDLFAAFREPDRMPYYLAHDTHWSPQGLAVAARAVAERVGLRGDVDFETREVTVRTHGDLVRMMRSPVIERHLVPEPVTVGQITAPTDAAPSPVLVLGDSFCRIFQNDEPRNAGFVSHLARELRMPVASLVNDGGAATLVRQELHRRPQLLDRKKVVVWVFTERDFRLATEGWQIVPLAKGP